MNDLAALTELLAQRVKACHAWRMAREWIETRIRGALKRLGSHPGFQTWLSAEKPSSDDRVCINNSFLFRDVSTNKSNQYLLARLGLSALSGDVDVATLGGQNLDFRRFASRQTAPPTEVIASAIAAEKQSLGLLVFALVSVVAEDRRVEAALHTKDVKRVVWDPKLSMPVQLDDDAIVINAVDDELGLWNEVTNQLLERGDEPTPQLQAEFARALDTLQGLGCASLRLPSSGAALRDGVLDRVIQALSVHHDQYDAALLSLKRAQTQQSRGLHFNDVLRIAYAFAADSLSLLKLIVSICDLKPIILWTSIDRHYALSEAFRDLPWTRSKSKPTTQNYSAMIGDARNHAFHNVLPFDKALHLELPPNAITGAELRIFSEYGSKSTPNQLKYDDQEVAEVLMTFTRARRRPTPADFWSKNSSVMKAMIELFKSTNITLKRLYQELHP